LNSVACRLDRRREAEQQARRRRDRRGKSQNANVGPRVESDPLPAVRHHRHQRIRRPPGQQDAQYARGRRQQHALCQHLPQDASASGAHRKPDGDLAPPGRRPTQQQIGEIRARINRISATIPISSRSGSAKRKRRKSNPFPAASSGIRCARVRCL
jgi:hypothetical protein